MEGGGENENAGRDGKGLSHEACRGLPGVPPSLLISPSYIKQFNCGIR